MPSVRIPKNFKNGMYFLTLTVKNCYYVLDRFHRWNILANSLKFFQKNRSSKVYGFVFMPNHIHLIIFSDDAIAFVRDFKKFTANQILKNIKSTEPNLLKLFETRKAGYNFWMKTNLPEFVESEKFFLQKLKYIHDNPVRREYVLNSEDWYWSSACPDSALKISKVE